MICPMCKGEKGGQGHVNYGGARPCEFKWIACMRCKGTGAVPDEQGPWIEAGMKRRAERLARDMSLWEEAKRLGISAAQLSAIEHGMRNPDEAPNPAA